MAPADRARISCVQATYLRSWAPQRVATLTRAWRCFAGGATPGTPVALAVAARRWRGIAPGCAGSCHSTADDSALATLVHVFCSM